VLKSIFGLRCGTGHQDANGIERPVYIQTRPQISAQTNSAFGNRLPSLDADRQHVESHHLTGRLDEAGGL